MGEVYIATDEALDRNVARDPSAPARSRRRQSPAIRHGSQAASSLNHPNIVTIYDRSDRVRGATRVGDGQASQPVLLI
jgi:serine/threonine protein kinase